MTVGRAMRVPCEAVLCAVVPHVAFRKGRGCARGQIVVAGMSRDWIGLQRWLIHWHALHSKGLSESSITEGTPQYRMLLSMLLLDACPMRF